MPIYPNVVKAVNDETLELADFLSALKHALDAEPVEGGRIGVFFITATHPLRNTVPFPPIIASELLDRIASCVGTSGRWASLDDARFVAFSTAIETLTHGRLAMLTLQAECNALLIEHGVEQRLRVGGTFYPDDSSAPSGLVMHAYSALLDSLVYGRTGSAVFDFATHGSDVHRQRIAVEVLAAIRSGRMEAFYQPKVNLVSGRIIGAEALVRMFGEDGAMRAPAEFLPHITSRNCLQALDLFMVETAIRQSVAWSEAGIDVAISVNVSPRMFDSRDFSDRVLALFDLYGAFNPQMLAFEVLESMDMADLQLAARLMAELQDRGVQIYLDDFGTGRSSAAYLKSLNVDGIKIDRSFVSQLVNGPESAKDRAILMGTHTIADAFELNIVAEGIETEEAARELIAIGIREGQGYYYGRPMPAAAFTQMYNQGKLPSATAAECQCAHVDSRPMATGGDTLRLPAIRRSI